uniref:Uncharacterized protein n=1 Tax=Mycena chlorophos TaxID=658473 RepID=A0ABQ0M8A1_MYCCL|nr:predicted protein [Mycena chlorophos]
MSGPSPSDSESPWTEPGAETVFQLHVLIGSLIAETATYGGFLVLCCVTVWLRLARYTPESRPPLSRMVCNFIVLSTAALFFLCTLHWVIVVVRFASALLETSQSPERSMLQSLRTCLATAENVNDAFTFLAIWTGDAVLIYRLWVIWNRTPHIIALPLLVWFGVVSIGGYLAYTFFQPLARLENESAHNRALFTWNWVGTLSINLYCTGLSAWRIWKACRASGALAAKPFMSVLVILVESAVLLTVWSIFFAIAFQTNSSLQILVTNLQAVVIGIANVVIYLRVEISPFVLSEHGHGRGRDVETGGTGSSPGIVMTNNASILDLDLALAGEAQGELDMAAREKAAEGERTQESLTVT